MFWELLRYSLVIGSWIAAIIIMWREKPYQAQHTTEEYPIGPPVEPAPDAFPLSYRSPYTGDLTK